MVCARIPYPIVDGGAHAIYTMLKSLHHSGFNVSVVSYESSKHSQDRSGVEAFAKISCQPKVNKPYGATDFFRSIIGGKPASITSRFDSSLFNKMMESFNEQDFDMVLYAGLQTCAHLSFLKFKYPKARHILYQVNVEHLLYKRISDGESSPLKKWAFGVQAKLMKRFEYESIRGVDEIIFISPKDERFFQQEIGSLKSIALLPPALMRPQGPNQGPNKHILCAYADWRWAPNSQGLSWFFNSVWPLIKKEVPTATMKIAGKHLTDSLLAKVKQLEGIEYVGFVHDLGKFIQSSDLLVAALPSGSGIKIKLVEAMAHSLPFVTTEIGFEGFNSPEIAELSVATNEQDFANKCVNLLLNNHLNIDLRQRVHAFAKENLDPDKYALAVNEFIS